MSDLLNIPHYMYSKSVFYRPPALEESNQESEEEEDIDESWSDEKVQEEIDRISVLRDLTGIIKTKIPVF